MQHICNETQIVTFHKKITLKVGIIFLNVLVTNELFTWFMKKKRRSNDCNVFNGWMKDSSSG